MQTSHRVWGQDAEMPNGLNILPALQFFLVGPTVQPQGDILCFSAIEFKKWLVCPAMLCNAVVEPRKSLILIVFTRTVEIAEPALSASQGHLLKLFVQDLEQCNTIVQHYGSTQIFYCAPPALIKLSSDTVKAC